jgi:hypothetical protein
LCPGIVMMLKVHQITYASLGKYQSGIDLRQSLK